MVGSKPTPRFAVVVMTVGAAFLVSSCAAVGLGEPPASVQTPGELTFALSDGAAGGGRVAVDLARISDSSGVDYVGTLTTAAGFDGPQGQFQLSLVGKLTYSCGLCNPFDPFPAEGWFGSLDTFTLTSPSGLQITGDAEPDGSFRDPSLCPTHIIDARVRCEVRVARDGRRGPVNHRGARGVDLSPTPVLTQVT